MTRNLKAVAEPQPSPLSADACSAAIVGPGAMGKLVSEILSIHGWEVGLHAEAGDVPAGDARAALVIFTERKLVEAARELKKLGPSGERPPAIVVCESIRAGEVRFALGSGVAGVVLTASLTSGLIPCVVAISAGQVCVPRSQARQVEAAALSGREKQILGMVVMGCMNGEIADRLVVAESTVKSHLSSAFGKLGVRSRNEAVELILDSERGLGIGILGLDWEPIRTAAGNSPSWVEPAGSSPK